MPVVAQCPRCLREHAHREQHAAHVWMTDDRHASALAGRLALQSLAREADRLLVRTLGDPVPCTPTPSRM
jgi:hypothetical protein